METFFVANSGQGIVLVISAAKPPDQGWFLLRYTTGGVFDGDTWHASLEDAKAQAGFEFSQLLNFDWREVKGTFADALAVAGR